MASLCHIPITRVPNSLFSGNSAVTSPVETSWSSGKFHAIISSFVALCPKASLGHFGAGHRVAEQWHRQQVITGPIRLRQQHVAQSIPGAQSALGSVSDEDHCPLQLPVLALLQRGHLQPQNILPVARRRHGQVLAMNALFWVPGPLCYAWVGK